MPENTTDDSEPASTDGAGRTALVTGAGRGLGATLTAFLCARGWTVVATSRSTEELTSLADKLNADGPGRVIAVAGDVRDPGHRTRLAAEAGALSGFGIVVNNAALMGVSPIAPLVEATTDVYQRVLETNVVAPLALIREAGPFLEPGSLIVNISSEAAVQAFPCAGVYGASKAAMDHAGRILALELAEAGIGVVAVDPGDMGTRMYAEAEPGVDLSALPSPESTLPFWNWLLAQRPADVSGGRFLAQEHVS
ncbi:NAD(P)-dependent dehydrogenase (short-subunit alcohol dehydrogenase family) [Nocardiopsis arvandica]|uniref:NAD(P)-dependent dehydrogenase (Short-subunit alcohol dehydrogenase family) n=1 Tax=Nocardiopsis sinuspersici TaxID=501010 RepID=A0A7Y9X8Y0_9ACTN|nr:SDR family oxidoreductase [Nocardiopsis sinuspersici]NYH50592.1 NAD(P)-dependent dehydrogenase (short-subunit alcohol dehydrogenase family) [Nocardiopsis sinuspersici]